MKIYNTATRKIDTFKSITDKKVTMYTCGPTVYASPHIGNMRSYIFADTLKRYLIFLGYEVKHVINITDVGHLVSDDDHGADKLEVSSQKMNMTAWEIAEKFTNEFCDNMIMLNCLSPHIYVKATDHIPEQIELIKKLESRNLIYKISDGIYFDTSKYPNYGLFSNEMDSINNKSRILENEEKRNSHDFALWKFSPQNEHRQMEWSSPWGIGFPGWHIECSAMAMKYLGETIDIHTGGVDHIKIHHQNEIAQSESATGKKFANYWIHVEFLKIYNNKMSKSLGNTYTLDYLKSKDYDPVSLRYLYLTSKYRTQLNFTFESLMSAQKSLSELKNIINDILLKYNIPNEFSLSLQEEIHQDIIRSIEEDMNTPKLIAQLWMVIKDKKINDTYKMLFIKTADEILGLNIINNRPNNEDENFKTPSTVINILNERKIARDNHDWLKADKLRNEIEDMGYEIIDQDDKSIVRPLIKK